MRSYECLNQGWRFFKNENDTGVKVDLPHTWNKQDGQDGGNDYYRGICIYQKSFRKPVIVPGGKVYLEFRGVNSSAEVKVNGISVGRHDGGYSTFRINITDALLGDVLLEENLQMENLPENNLPENNLPENNLLENNLLKNNLLKGNQLEVLVDNSPNNRVYPQRADFTFYGGIYRDVYMITVPESHFDLDYHGGPGIMVTPEINGTEAIVKVKTFIKGNYDKVNVTIEGAGTMEAVKCGSHAEAVFHLPKVHLWNGRKDPYLYSVQAELLVKEQVTDQVSTRFGCRSYSFDKDRGFLLNGKPYPLHGVSRHQDRKDVGNALTKAMHEEDMQLILDMGANSIRLAHYQHDQYFYDLCDEKGMIVWAEIPYISTHMPEGRENTISQMTELIAQNYNHPSIICWALSNEITLTGITEDLIENHHILNNLAHNMDKTRVTSMANLFMLETDNPILNIPDIMSYNLYYGWYLGELEENDKFFDDFRAKYPDKIIGLSEYGADTYYKIQSAKPEKGDYSEQYQCIYHEHMLKMFAKRPYLWSTYVWNMFDFAADAREEAGDNGVNHKGLISFDRKVKKDAYYLYKSYWSDEGFVHLCGSRYVERTEAVTEVKVYSNKGRVALYMDGKLLEEKEGNQIFVFQVPIDGEHELTAKSEFCSDTMKIRKVEKANPDYLLKSTTVHNWFEEPGMEVKPGYFSIKDTIKDISQVPEGKALIDHMMEQTAASKGDMVKNVEISEAMKQMINRFTVESLLKQAGGGIQSEMVIMLNKQLTMIKKP